MRLVAQEVGGKQQLVIDAKGMWQNGLHLSDGGYTPDDARRLAACWNACDGVPTDKIEDYTEALCNVVREGGARHSVLLAERDQLRADLAEACARNNELIEHQAAKAIELAEARANAGMLASEHRETLDEREMLRTDFRTLEQSYEAKCAELAAARALLGEVAMVLPPQDDGRPGSLALRAYELSKGGA